VKVAILTLTTGVDVPTARRLLEQHHGNLSTAIGGLLHG
jgi:N-acetylmuramic acid 6-phosphate (MurNAc-6-P) etherase